MSLTEEALLVWYRHRHQHVIQEEVERLLLVVAWEMFPG